MPSLANKRVRQFDFDPALLGWYEKEGWRAYYDRRWLAAFWLLVRLNREQFAMRWLAALLAARDTVRAARAFAPVANNLAATRRFLHSFFVRAHRARPLAADPATVAELELEYWVVHRAIATRIAAQAAAADTPDHAGRADAATLAPLIATLTRLHVAIFGGSEASMHRSALLRAQAAATVDRITGKRSPNIAADWREVELLLQEAYIAAQTGR